MNRIRVNLDKRLSASYDIHIGRDILDRMAPLLAKSGWAGRWYIITDSNVSRLHGERLLEVLRGNGLAAETVEFAAGESSKTIATCIGLAEELLKRGARVNDKDNTGQTALSYAKQRESPLPATIAILKRAGSRE